MLDLMELTKNKDMNKLRRVLTKACEWDGQVRSILIRPRFHIVLYEHCTGPAGHKEKQLDGRLIQVGPYKAIGPPLSGGW